MTLGRIGFRDASSDATVAALTDAGLAKYLRPQ